MTVAFGFTSADLERMPDIEGVRYEIIDGDLLVSRQPTISHQYVCMVLGTALHMWNTHTGAGVAVQMPGLVFSEDNDVIPDLVWISHERRRVATDAKGHFRFAPDLVVEVLSPGPVNEQCDKTLKLDLYSRQGVLEYWIVDSRQRTLEVFRREGDGLRRVTTLADGDELTSPLFPGFACPIATLWAPPIDG